jgi:TPR repeat protein
MVDFDVRVDYQMEHASSWLWRTKLLKTVIRRRAAIDRMLGGITIHRHYYKLSADQGKADAQSIYGVLLANADGIAMDKSLAAQYHILSGDQGNARVQAGYQSLQEDLGDHNLNQ